MESARHSERTFPIGKHRYRSVVEGVAMANEFLASGLGMSAFARQKGVSLRMVKYWSARARQLAEESARPAPQRLLEVASVNAQGALALAPGLAVDREPGAAPPSARAVASTIEVRLPNGFCIGVGAGFAPEVLRAVVRCLLEAVSC